MKEGWIQLRLYFLNFSDISSDTAWLLQGMNQMNHTRNSSQFKTPRQLCMDAFQRFQSLSFKVKIEKVCMFAEVRKKEECFTRAVLRNLLPNTCFSLFKRNTKIMFLKLLDSLLFGFLVLIYWLKKQGFFVTRELFLWAVFYKLVRVGMFVFPLLLLVKGTCLLRQIIIVSNLKPVKELWGICDSNNKTYFLCHLPCNGF